YQLVVFLECQFFNCRFNNFVSFLLAWNGVVLDEDVQFPTENYSETDKKGKKRKCSRKYGKEAWKNILQEWKQRKKIELKKNLFFYGT
ncbi:MAG: hypothetical protein ACE5GN_07995, partial [Waddliaceae bacterium]